MIKGSLISGVQWIMIPFDDGEMVNSQTKRHILCGYPLCVNLMSPYLLSIHSDILLSVKDNDVFPIKLCGVFDDFKEVF